MDNISGSIIRDTPKPKKETKGEKELKALKKQVATLVTNAKKEMKKVIKTASDLYDAEKRKEHYDFLVTLESAAKTMGY